MRSILGYRSAAVLAGVLLLACASGRAQEKSSAPPNSLAIKSASRSINLSVADFHVLPHVSLTVHNSHSDANENYSGVPLAALLEKVGAPMGKELHGDAMASYLIATGSDGYAVVLSLAEVDPEFHAGQVIVADTREGQPLGKNGPFQLIVTDDKRPARWVHNLVSIALQRAH